MSHLSPKVQTFLMYFGLIVSSILALAAAGLLPTPVGYLLLSLATVGVLATGLLLLVIGGWPRVPFIAAVKGLWGED